MPRVLVALVLGVIVPAASIIWFMTEAASNQADAARQRLSDSLRGQLRLLSERIDAWSVGFTLASGSTPTGEHASSVLKARTSTARRRFGMP